MWSASTQEVEGCNNLTKHMCRLAPGISWPLLSSRITNKQLTNTLATPESRAEFVSECVDFHPQVRAAVWKQRWAEANPADYDCFIPRRTGKMDREPRSRHHRCAAKVVVKMKRILKERLDSWTPSAERIFSIKVEGNDEIVLVPATKHYQEMWVTKALFINPAGSDLGKLCLKMPLESKSLLFFMHEAHERARPEIRAAHRDMQVQVLRLAWDLDGEIPCAHVADVEELVNLTDVCRPVLPCREVLCK